jgi:hypothetical protein
MVSTDGHSVDARVRQLTKSGARSSTRQRAARALIRTGSGEGRAGVKLRGAKMGWPPALTHHQVKEALCRSDAGERRGRSRGVTSVTARFQARGMTPDPRWVVPIDQDNAFLLGSHGRSNNSVAASGRPGSPPFSPMVAYSNAREMAAHESPRSVVEFCCARRECPIQDEVERIRL